MASIQKDADGRLYTFFSAPTEGINIDANGRVYDFRTFGSNGVVDAISGKEFPDISFAPDVTYLLDDHLTNVGGFWSRHKLTSDATYSGAIERMRVDTTGQPEADYNVASDGLFVDTDAELAAAGSNSAYITTLYDQSGNAFNQGNATTAQQYRSINAGTLDTKNSNPCMEAPGALKYTYRSTGNMGINGPSTIMAVCAHDGGVSNIIWATQGLGAYGYCSGLNIFSKGSLATSTGGAHGVAYGTLFLATWILDGANSDVRVNGVSKDTTNVGDAGSSGFIDIGYSGSDNFFIQSAGELLCWKANIGLTDIAAIEADVMSRWGIA